MYSFLKWNPTGKERVEQHQKAYASLTLAVNKYAWCSLGFVGFFHHHAHILDLLHMAWSFE